MIAKKKIVNLIGLGIGYLLGQGSFLIASFYLLSNEKYETASAVGFGMSVVTLSLLIIDMGGQIYLSRQVAIDRNLCRDTGIGASDEVLKSIFSIILIRLISWASLLLCVGIFGRNLGFAEDPLSERFILISIACLFFWIFNQTGVLDGQRLQGWSGLSLSIPWVFVSAATIALSNYDVSPSFFGIFLGLSFGAGSLIAVILQIVVSRIFYNLRIARICVRDILMALRIGGGAFLSQLPGQLNGRVQIYFAMMLFSPELAAAFILSRNVLNASNNLVGMARRIEFPDLVALLGTGCVSISVIFRRQKMSFLFSILICIFCLMCGIASYTDMLPSYLKGSSDAILINAIFVPVLVSSTISGALVQAMLASGKSFIVALSSVISFFLSTLIVWLLIDDIMVYAMVLASIVSNVVISVLMMSSIQKRRM
ncbi:hypothetical protein [Rhodobacter sp. 24-YEA-8]|uniref:hypothetical protein n=1 Tax=Rhodobacter sp. 24-YEA-8 TaxID=1884310 RepID=UPI00089577F9|nr:hypothetical protein [Rhodobacter sp. 24-YEA-8]SED90685.1 hypothetical protein SAMN05519105_4838 [Rhodobacter sp. 24-YEA-8]